MNMTESSKHRRRRGREREQISAAGGVMGSSCSNEARTRLQGKHSCNTEAVGEVVGPLSGDVFKSRLSKPPLGIT